MKLFTVRFFGGICVVAVGLFAIFGGILPLLSPEKTTEYSIIGVALILIGAVLVRLGFIIAKDSPKVGSKVAVDTLRRAKLLERKRKK